MRFSWADFSKAEGLQDPDGARLQRLTAVLALRFRMAFLEFVRRTTDPEIVEHVASLIEAGDIESAMAIVDSHIRVFGSIYPDLFSQAATEEVRAILPQLSAKVGVAFDAGLPDAAALMRRNQLELVQGLAESQRAAIREAMASGLERGQGPRVMAQAFRDAIGLAPQQVEIVARYRRLLEANSAEALNANLRDRRFDGSLEGAIESGRPLAPQKIDQMVDRYRSRWLDYRARTIARTETVRLLSQAQEAAMAQTMQQAQLRPDQVDQTWWTNIDGRERETHEAMHLQIRPWGEPFQSPSGALLRYPGDPEAPAAEVVNCRCRRTFRVKLDSQRAA